jgi:hypothetical protein
MPPKEEERNDENVDEDTDDEPSKHEDSPSVFS